MHDHSIELDQYDFIDDEYFFKAMLKYSWDIGEFLMNFSYLEHELEVAIAEFISDRGHDVGYLFITKIDELSEKIDLFYKYYKMFEYDTNKEKTELKEIFKALISISQFRNQLAHAKWQTMQKDGKVRTKIKINTTTGRIEFKNVIIKPKDIRAKIKEIHRIIKKIDKYKEKVSL